MNSPAQVADRARTRFLLESDDDTSMIRVRAIGVIPDALSSHGGIGDRFGTATP